MSSSRPLKITQINTFDIRGGASIGCLRITESLRSLGTEARMLVLRQVGSTRDFITPMARGYVDEKLALARVAYDKLLLRSLTRAKFPDFSFNLARWGYPLHRHPAVQQADVLHLHWINQGMLSLQGLERLAQLGKPILWTLHDMWAFTGGCFYSGTCKRYELGCGRCPLLVQPHQQDVSAKQLAHKAAIYRNLNIIFATPSRWLAETALQSQLLRHYRVVPQPNPLNTQIFRPQDQPSLRKKLNLPLSKKLILFGVANVNDPRKGWKYLEQALQTDNLQQICGDTELVVFGKSSVQNIPGFRIHHLGAVTGDERIAEIYGACDVYVLPSIADNLPYTLVETLCCGVPAVAFAVGGIPEMIDHQQTGYLAEPRSVQDLARGLVFVLENPERRRQMAERARRQAVERYAYPVVAAQYQLLYEELLATCRD